MSIDDSTSREDHVQLHFDQHGAPVCPTVTDPDRTAPWTDLRCDIPNSLSETRQVSLAECILVELKHEPVAVRLAFRDEWTLFFHSEFASGDHSEEFVRHRLTSATGQQTVAMLRADVRDQLLTYLSRSESAGWGSMTVRPLSRL
ncbi:hypothetical protein ACOZ4N_00845 (plasmid) [Halorientalis pallida]|uniref:hypothetical protein n=1 Tax=Halorientalis pallida TaxID=2479928 RepID=UPI003C6F7D36